MLTEKQVKLLEEMGFHKLGDLIVGQDTYVDWLKKYRVRGIIRVCDYTKLGHLFLHRVYIKTCPEAQLDLAKLKEGGIE
jgi:hypothetical protein